MTMKKVIRRYATFLAPGLIVANDWTQPVESSDPLKVEWPENAYAFTLHEREVVIDGDAEYIGQSQQVGPIYYHPDSKVETLEQARLNPLSTNILLENMRINGWKQIVWSRWGSFPQPFDNAKAVVLKAVALPETDHGR
jgi:hypothetical protein